MKSYDVSVWIALLNVTLLAGCGGTSSIGSGSGGGGEAGAALGGASAAGSAGASFVCQTADDCRALSDGPCAPCLDDKCAVPACLGNSCQLVCVVP